MRKKEGAMANTSPDQASCQRRRPEADCSILQRYPSSGLRIFIEEEEEEREADFPDMGGSKSGHKQAARK